MVATAGKAQSKYQGIVDEWRGLIQSGHWQVGAKLPTFAEITATRGLATNTINRALLELEQEGLVERRKGSGVYVAAPRKNRHATIAICGYDLHPDDGVHYWFEHMAGMRRGLTQHNLGSFMLGQESVPPWDDMAGILGHQSPHFCSLLQRIDWLPKVGVMTPHVGISTVVADDHAGASLAVEHLLRLGHRRVGCMMWTQNHIGRRLDGYRAALLEAGITPQARWSRAMRYFKGVGGAHENRGYLNMRHWLASGFAATGCTALLVHNDMQAYGVIRALREAGLEVPRDISIVGFDGVEELSPQNPYLTTVVLPLAEITATAVDVLMRHIETPTTPPVTYVLPVKLRVGATTAPPRADVKQPRATRRVAAMSLGK